MYGMLYSVLCTDLVHFECDKSKSSGGYRNHSNELLIPIFPMHKGIWLTQLYFPLRALSCESNCSSIIKKVNTSIHLVISTFRCFDAESPINSPFSQQSV